MSQALTTIMKWQDLSRACLHAGRPPGGPWNVRVNGTCPITREYVQKIGLGPSFLDAIEDLYSKMEFLHRHAVIEALSKAG